MFCRFVRCYVVWGECLTNSCCLINFIFEGFGVVLGDFAVGVSSWIWFLVWGWLILWWYPNDLILIPEMWFRAIMEDIFHYDGVMEIIKNNNNYFTVLHPPIFFFFARSCLWVWWHFLKVRDKVSKLFCKIMSFLIFRMCGLMRQKTKNSVTNPYKPFS